MAERSKVRKKASSPGWRAKGAGVGQGSHRDREQHRQVQRRCWLLGAKSRAGAAFMSTAAGCLPDTARLSREARAVCILLLSLSSYR